MRRGLALIICATEKDPQRYEYSSDLKMSMIERAETTHRLNAMLGDLVGFMRGSNRSETASRR